MTGDPIYPDVLIYLDQDDDGVPETDISALVCSSITGQHGNFNADDSDRTASTGKISFDIENASRAYTGVDFIGKAVSIVLRFAGQTKQVYYGVIQAPTNDDSGPILPLHIKLTVPDWIQTANNTRLTGLEVTTFKRSDEALETLMDGLINPPARLDLETGTEIFENVFDGAGPKSKVFAEIDRLTKSELGQTYLRFRDDGTGEILVHENKYHRGAAHPLSRVPIQRTDPPLLMYHGNAGASGLLLYHGNAGASGYIKVGRAQDASFDRRHYKADWSAGAVITNDMTVTNVFRTTDVSSVVLYEITYPIKIGTTQIERIDGNYSNPDSGQLIQAFDIAVSELVFNSAADGSGTDLSPYLQNAGFAFYANRFFMQFLNTGPVGYITSFKVSGKGIYKHSPVNIIAENLESQERLRTVYPDALTREYSNELATSRIFANGILGLRRLPNMDLTSVSYQGNMDELALMSFMYLEQGDKVHIIEEQPDHAGDYYIQGVKFKISLGGAVDYTWFLREDVETMTEPIAVRAPASLSTTAIDFGILPHLANLPAYSYSMWVKRHNASSYAALIGRSVDDGTGRRGSELYLNGDDLFFRSYKTPTDGNWTAANVLPSLDVYYHVALVYDNSSDRAEPIFYVNAAAVSYTEDLAPSGTSDDDSDCPLIIFNVAPNPGVPGQRYLVPLVNNVSIKDFRVYGRALDPAEISLLSAGEDDLTTVPAGKLFHGIRAPIRNLADYVGDTIEDDDLVLESVYGVAGVPYHDDPALILEGESI